MRRLSAAEQALWNRVVASVTPLHPDTASLAAAPVAAPEPVPVSPRPVRATPPPRQTVSAPKPGETLDGSWDRRLSRGLVQPDATVDLHGHNLATAYDLLDRRLEQGIADGARLLLLITGKPPSEARKPSGRGAIRAAVGDWLGASRHAGSIAAVRGAHPRHGGSGALYIILRRKR